jgi:voltage-gated potassium channel
VETSVEFSQYFLRVLVVDLLYASPILLFLVVLITFVGHIVGRIEGWSRSDAMYHAFINATTVGYGDFRPTKKASKMLAIAIALVGIVFTGLVVAIAIHAADLAYAHAYGAGGLVDRLRE